MEEKKKSFIIRVDEQMKNIIEQQKKEMAAGWNISPANISTQQVTPRIAEFAKIGREFESKLKKNSKGYTFNDFMDEFFGMKQNKKGIIDVLFVMAMLFGLAIAVLFSLLIAGQVNNAFTPIVTNMSNSTYGNLVNSTITQATDFGDWIFMVGLMLGLLGIIITSFLFFSHPAFIAIYIILALGAIASSAILANAYDSISSNAVFNATITQLPMTSYVMQHFALVIWLVIIVSIVIIYVKSQNRGQAI